MKPSNTIVVSPKYIEEKERQIADLSKKAERLREQLKEANEVIKYYAEKHGKLKSCDYLNKWGVK